MQAGLQSIQKILTENSSPDAKASHQKFIPGQEKIYGVSMPFLNELASRYKAGGFELAEELWKAGALEEKVLAAKILGKIARKDPVRSIELVRDFSTAIGSWAVCDAIGMQALKPLVTTHRSEIFALAEKLSLSKDPWQRRLSLVIVEWYTRDIKMHAAIKKLVKSLENDPEYYVKKAVTWIRRNLEKGK